MSGPLLAGNPKALAAELFRACAWGMAGNADEAACKAAYWLFAELNKQVGRTGARGAFWQFAKPLTQRRRNEIRNHGLLDRLDMMVDAAGNPAPNMLGLAKRMAAENALLTPNERKARGSAGSTDVSSLAKHIRDIVKRREQGLKNRTWHGPVTEEQAMRHFLAKKVATISKKK